MDKHKLHSNCATSPAFGWIDADWMPTRGLSAASAAAVTAASVWWVFAESHDGLDDLDVRWSSSDGFQLLTRLRRPAVIRLNADTPWDTWRRSWSIEALVDPDGPYALLPLVAQRSLSATFGYSAQEGADHLLVDGGSLHLDDLRTTLGGAVRSVLEYAPGDAYIYASTPLSNLGPRVQAQAAGWESLAVREVEEAVGGAPLASLWLGGANVTTQAHYDVDHNTHVQIVGRKRWVILPPDASADLALFGFLHPRYRTSQVALPGAEATGPARSWLLPAAVRMQFPRAHAALATALTIELDAGDALYVPPFWTHHVTCLGAGRSSGGAACVSINVFSSSRAFEWLLTPPFTTSMGYLWCGVVWCGVTSMGYLRKRMGESNTPR